MRITSLNATNSLCKNNLENRNINFSGVQKIKPLSKNALNKKVFIPLATLSMLILPFCKSSELNVPKNKATFEVDGTDTLDKALLQGLRLDINSLENPQSVYSGLAGIFDVDTFERVEKPIAINSDELKILEAIEDNDNEPGISYKDFETAVNMLYHGQLKDDLNKKGVRINNANFDEYSKELKLRPQERSFSISLTEFDPVNYYSKLTNVLKAEGAEQKFLPRLGDKFPFVKKTLGAPVIYRDEKGNIQRIFYTSNLDYLKKESMEFCYYPNGKLRSIVACDSNSVVSQKDGLPANEYGRVEFDEEGYVTYAFCDKNPFTIKVKNAKGFAVKKTVQPGNVFKKD